MIRVFSLFAVLFLVACQPDIDVEFSTDDVNEVILTKKTKLIEFEARIEDKFTTIDDNKKNEVNSIAKVIGKYFKGVEIETSFSARGFEIEIEGELELAFDTDDNQAPWFMQVVDYSDGNFLVTLNRTKIWDAFSAELKEVSFFAKPDQFLPLNIKLKNDGGRVFVGGIILDGTPLGGFHIIELDGSRINMSFDGDHWKKAPASFYFKAG